MPWYKTGSVKATNNSNAIIGTGTAFIANARVGDAFRGPDGAWYEVSNIASDTALSISPNYQGSTVAAGGYALAPMQGYVKDLADQVRGIIQQWGTALANLGTVSTENVVPVAKGGTGGTNQAAARSGLGLKSAAVADILGGVTQEGGVPTGAIFQRGSNANGEFCLMADGTAICTYLQLSMSAAANTDIAVNWQFPCVFAVAPAVLVALRGPASTNTFTINKLQAAPSSVTAAAITGNFSAAQNYFITLTAIGRWF